MWHQNPLVVCERYTDPRFANYERGACKECKVQCRPVDEACEGIKDLKAGFWNKTGKKVTAQYIERAEQMSAERAMMRRQNQFEKETAKVTIRETRKYPGNAGYIPRTRPCHEPYYTTPWDIV